MMTENGWMKRWLNIKFNIFFVVMPILTTVLLLWVLIMLYDTKSELNIIKENSWNAYDSADAIYQKLRVVWNDVENILNHAI